MPYWPAKVIRTMPDGSYDVRFFGGYHQRALVEKPSIRPITTNIHTLQVKRTSLWNKASDELKKHQEFVTKVKSALPDFQKDLYGDPFIACEEIRDFIGNLEESDAENDENQDEADMEELEQIKSALEEEDGSSKIYSQTMQNLPTIQPNALVGSGPAPDVSPAKKKKPGRPGRPPKNKYKKESNENGLEENMVSSSSQEPRVASIAIQTPSKLLKDLLQGTTKISKEELRQLKEKVNKNLSNFAATPFQ